MTRSPDSVRARLFDAERPDERLDPERAFSTRPADSQLLWIDLTGDVGRDVLLQLAPLLDLQPRTLRSLARPDDLPYVALHKDYLHVRIAVHPSDSDDSATAWLDVIAGRNIVITRHVRPVPFLDDVDSRIQRDAPAGSLSDAAFFTVIVDAAIASYHTAVDAIEEDVDRLDTLSLRAAPPAALGELVRCRRRIARLRRLLADHRSVFSTLGSPELGSIIEDTTETALVAGLAGRFDGALSAVEESREALLGSFDVYMSRTAQRTNEVMKVLTLATVLLLPGSMLAGLLGMNVTVPLDKDDPMSFWLVIGLIGVLAIGIVWYARRRRWL